MNMYLLRVGVVVFDGRLRGRSISHRAIHAVSRGDGQTCDLGVTGSRESHWIAGSRRRRVIAITDALRDEVANATQAVRSMLASGRLPSPTTDERRCKGCSLRDRCQPEALQRLQDPKAREELFDPIDG